MSETKTAWTRLSERMPDEYPCLVRWVEGHEYECGVFVASGIVCDSGDKMATFRPVDRLQVLHVFYRDQSEWAPIPE